MEFRDRLEMHGMRVTGSIPVLACLTCKNTVVPTSVEKSVKKAVQGAREANQKTCTFAPREQRFALCGDVKFRYSSTDCEIIAGLGHAEGENAGYHVPVFFSEDVLFRYRLQKKYRIEARKIHRRIVFPGGAGLDYGTNRHGRVFCWLGDLDKIPQEEQARMKEHNVESDHDVISGLYKKHRLGMDLDNVLEERLKSSIYGLAEASRAHAGFSIHKLGHADRHLAERLERPREWRRDITQALVNLVMLCKETIDTESLKGSMNGKGEKTNAELDILEGWIKFKLSVDPKSIMPPFRVLNGWRNYRVHRDNTGDNLRRLRELCTQLGMEEDDYDDERMYDLILEGMISSCHALTAGIEGRWPARE